MTGRAPLSPAQQRLWFLHQLRPADPAYNIVTALEIGGPLAPAALAAATGAIVARHEALHATFALAGARPVQLCRPGRPVRPRLVDLTGPPAVAPDRWLRELAARPFDLAAGPVAEWTLLRLAPDRHVLVFAVHHIVFDGGSLAVVCDDLAELYLAGLDGRPARLPPASQVQGPAAAGGSNGAAGGSGDPAPGPAAGGGPAGLAYWRRHLAGAPQHLRVFPGTEEPDGERGVCGATFTLGRGRTGELAAFAGRARSTPFMVLLAAFGGLLRRYSGQHDLVVGTPVSLREPGAAAVGLFLNMLALRLDLSGDPSLVDLLGRVRGTALDAFQYRAVPFERLVDELRPVRDLGHTPLFQAVFAYQRSPEPPRLHGTRTRLLPVDAPAAKYALTVIATEVAGDTELTVQADRGTCDLAAAQLFAANLDTLLAGWLREPTRPLSRLPMLGAVEPVPAAAGRPGGAPVPGTSVPGTPVAGAPALATGSAAGALAAGSVAGAPVIGPRNELEGAIAAAWRETLAVDEVDVRSSFFDLGGNSLLLLELHARLHTSLGMQPTVADLFRFPTVAGLAEHLGGAAGPAPAAAAAARGARRRDALGRRARRGATA